MEKEEEQLKEKNKIEVTPKKNSLDRLEKAKGNYNWRIQMKRLTQRREWRRELDIEFTKSLYWLNNLLKAENFGETENFRRLLHQFRQLNMRLMNTVKHLEK
jgi:hypothetical protein